MRFPRPSGHDWLRHGQVEGDGSLGARRVSLARIADLSTDSLLPRNAPYRQSSSLFFAFDEGHLTHTPVATNDEVTDAAVEKLCAALRVGGTLRLEARGSASY